MYYSTVDLWNMYADYLWNLEVKFLILIVAFCC